MSGSESADTYQKYVLGTRIGSGVNVVPLMISVRMVSVAVVIVLALAILAFAVPELFAQAAQQAAEKVTEEVTARPMTAIEMWALGLVVGACIIASAIAIYFIERGDKKGKKKTGLKKNTTQK